MEFHIISKHIDVQTHQHLMSKINILLDFISDDSDWLMRLNFMMFWLSHYIALHHSINLSLITDLYCAMCCRLIKRC